MGTANNSAMTEVTKKSIALGSGKCYCIDTAGTSYDLSSNYGLLQLLAEMEADENKLAYIKGGATLGYEATTYTATDDLGLISKTKPTEDKADLKLGIISTINQDYLEKLFSTVDRDDDDIQDMVVNRVGGVDNDDGKTYYFLFVNEDADGDTLVLIKGKNTAALSRAFAPGAESNIEPDIAAEPLDANGRKFIIGERKHGRTNAQILADYIISHGLEPAEDTEPATEEPSSDTEETGTLASIEAVFTQPETSITTETPLDDLKQYLVVTAIYDNEVNEVVNDYTLSGTLSVGTSEVTVTYADVTTTFNVTVSE